MPNNRDGSLPPLSEDERKLFRDDGFDAKSPPHLGCLNAGAASATRVCDGYAKGGRWHRNFLPVARKKLLAKG